MRGVLSGVIMLIAGSASAQSFDQAVPAIDATFGLYPYSSEGAPVPVDVHSSASAKREKLGDGLADVLGIQHGLPKPGTCRLVLIPSFRLTCASDR